MVLVAPVAPDAPTTFIPTSAIFVFKVGVAALRSDTALLPPAPPSPPAPYTENNPTPPPAPP
jgi:hypothetical protein